ncbi:Methyltransferase/trans-aconitate 2-methyltransferase [Trichoderma simmonsii]|uniref:Methyltransferase/trans-aconitate 2-methyltransferase n=1 Tax=Trichoderma simmonsii TaxID=1491479 RepID=A0A8G0LF46_9HYPO|nr:Methyltransferase/trans-aconitate 2-methyltransferase [Trichoderma simmonsii]
MMMCLSVELVTAPFAVPMGFIIWCKYSYHNGVNVPNHLFVSGSLALRFTLGSILKMGDTEELATEYTRVSNTQYGTGLFLLERLNVAPGMRVLDVGCGPGNLTAHIAEIVGKNGSVVGIDPSTERILIARKIQKSNLSFFEGQAEDLSQFPAESFDAVYVNSTLHWVQDQPAAVKEFGRLLRPGGLLGISGGSGDTLSAQEMIKAEVLSREPYRKYPEESPPKFLKQRELERLLDDAGFPKRSIVVNKITKSTKDADEMIDWLDASSSGKTYGSIPLELRPRAREEMEAEWNKLLVEDGIHMDIDLLVTVAVKA